MVIAADPVALSEVHGITNVIGGPTAQLSNGGGTLRLRKPSGAVVLEVRRQITAKPGILNGTFLPFATEYNPKVDEYITYNLSLTYRYNKDLTVIAGIKNLFNQDPPFSIAYDTNTGAGSSWEPRIADPRGRAFTLSVQYKFL